MDQEPWMKGNRLLKASIFTIDSQKFTKYTIQLHTEKAREIIMLTGLIVQRMLMTRWVGR